MALSSWVCSFFRLSICGGSSGELISPKSNFCRYNASLFYIKHSSRLVYMTYKLIDTGQGKRMHCHLTRDEGVFGKDFSEFWNSRSLQSSSERRRANIFYLLRFSPIYFMQGTNQELKDLRHRFSMSLDTINVQDLEKTVLVVLLIWIPNFGKFVKAKRFLVALFSIRKCQNPLTLSLT